MSGQPTMTDDEVLAQAFKEAGVDLNSIQKEEQVAQQKETSKKVVSQIQDVLNGTNEAPAQGTAEKLGKGAVIGLQDLVRYTYNGFVDLSDAAENFAASKGYGTGDLINESSKMVDPYKDKKLDTTTEVARKVTQYAAPLLGGAVTGSVKGAMAAEAIYSFFAIDPDDKRLSDALKGTAVEEVPILADIIQGLQTKPDDTELNSRLKNLGEGLGIGGALTGMVWGASKVYSGLRTAKNSKILEKAIQEKSSPTPLLDEAAVAASDTKISAAAAKEPPKPVVTSEQAAADDLPLFEKEWSDLSWDKPGVEVKAAADGAEETIKVNLSDDNLVDFFSSIAKNTDDVAKLRGPISDAETFAAVQRIKNDPEVIKKIASWTPDQGALTDKELIVGKYISSKAEESVKESSKLLDVDKSPTVQLKVARDFENFIRIRQIEKGISSEGGRVLRANQALGILTGRGDKEALKMLGTQGRAKMYDDLIKKYGGTEGIKNTSDRIKLMEEVSRVSKIPDTNFTTKMNEVVELTQFDNFQDAVTKVSLSSMLSDPATWARATVGNALNSAKSLVDNYISVGMGAARDMWQGTKTGMSLAEANARARAQFSGIVEGFIPAAKSFASMKSPLYGTAKFELSPTMLEVPDIDEAGVKQAWEWVNDTGVAVNVLTAGQLPRRALISVDAYFAHMNFKSGLAGELVTLQKQGRFTTPEEIAKFWDNPAEVARDSFIKARRDAGVATFSNPQVEGTAGYAVANAIETITDSFGVPFKKAVTPFVNTGINIARATTEMTPIGGIFALAKRGPTYRALQAGGREADMAMAKLASGSSAIIATMYLFDTEDLIEGRAKTKEQIAFAKAFPAGKDVPQGPAIRAANGKYYSLNGLEPFSTIVNAASRLKTISGLIDEDEYTEAASTFRLLMQDAYSPDSYTQGMSDLLSVITGNEDPEKGLMNLATRFVPYSGAMNAIKRVADPIKRDASASGSDLEDSAFGALSEFADKLQARIEARVPMMSNGRPAMRNFFGKVVEMPDGLGPDIMSPIAVSKGDSLELKRALERVVDFSDKYEGQSPYIKDYSINMPTKVISIPTDARGFGKVSPYEMSSKEYQDFLSVRNGVDPETGELLPLSRGATLEQKFTDILSRYGMFEQSPRDLYQADEKQYLKMITELKREEAAHTDEARQHMINVYENARIRKTMNEKEVQWMNFELPGDR